MYFLALISLKSAITRGAYVKAFLLVGEGVKGISIKLKGGIMRRCSFRGGCDIDITIYYDMEKAASRSWTVVVLRISW